MKRSPDAYLIMPLGGVYSMEGFVQTFLSFGERVGQEMMPAYSITTGNPVIVSMLSNWLGNLPRLSVLKVGTNEGEVSGLCEEIGDHGLVIWGVGDRSTEAAVWVPAVTLPVYPYFLPKRVT